MNKAMIQTMAVLTLCAAPAFAEDVPVPGDAEVGKQIYERYCATCHGLDGKGNGPMQAVLTLVPKDLTKLTAENEGVFPLARAVKRIDGRDPLVAHGSPMPVYGDFFETGAGVALRTEAGQPVMTSQPVADLLAYLGTLQEE